MIELVRQNVIFRGLFTGKIHEIWFTTEKTLRDQDFGIFYTGLLRCATGAGRAVKEVFE